MGFEPKNKDDLQDQKATELAHSVWLDGEQDHNFDEMEENFVDDLIEIGEEAAKVFYDPTEGDIIGHYALRDENGQDTEVPDLSRPVHKGKIIIEEIETYNLVRPVECKAFHQAEWLAIRKMVNIDRAHAKFQDEEQRKLLNTSANQTYNVFDAAYGGYRKTEKEVFLIEMYFRPCERYPEGWFVFMTRDGIVEEGELPGAIFPIRIQTNSRVHGSPRGRSPIKTMRPFQVEINRCASKIAEHHVTVGDDKLILPNGSKASPGIAMPGVRTVNVTGAAPQVLAGRDGSQFLTVAQATTTELYAVMGVPETYSDATEGVTDPYMMLFRSAKQKEPHNRRVRRHARFKRAVVQTYLELAKIHLPEETMIRAVGKNEFINISEFKNTNELSYQVKLSDQVVDMETKLGQQIMFSHVLQYASNKFGPDDLGMLIKQMPYANGVAALSNLTMDCDKADNEILALDRGEMPPVNISDPHLYMVKRLSKRMGEASFKLLAPEIQQAYSQKMEIHQQFQAYNVQMQMRLEQGLIPTTGPMVVMDYYVADPGNPQKTQRLKLPSDTIRWVLDVVQKQGTMVDSLTQLPEGVQAQITQKAFAQPGPGGSQPMERPGLSSVPRHPQGGAAQPQGGQHMGNYAGIPPAASQSASSYAN